MTARTNPNAATTVRPGVVLAIVGLVLVQAYRVVALGLAQNAVTDTGSQAWFFPALADTAFGITAPFAGLALWRLTGLGAWVGGIAWLSLSLFDFVDGLATTLAIGPPRGFDVSTADATAVLVAWIAVDVVALVLLSLPATRAHYLNARPRPPDG